ncbi:MAG TPA: penicillin-binding protein activator [Burkholderiales bacterium]|nr:penicillin-binding protein activator [Burkholderiales bacterium]
MQRLPAFLLTLLAILYGCAIAFATRAENGVPSTGQTVPAKPAGANTQSGPPKPHIALILPLKSESFGGAAEITRQGFIAAASRQGGSRLPVRTYATSEQTDEILATYQLALDAGAQVVVGPLTRDSVTALAISGMVRVPTLALNVPEDSPELPPYLFIFSLQVENETRQIARLAWHDGKRKALIISADTPLDSRMQQTFADEWQKLGGVIVRQLLFNGEQSSLMTLKQAVEISEADMIFLALEAKNARLVRPYIDLAVNIYGTSQIFSGNGLGTLNLDLNGVRFVDMPWLLQSDHPAVMVYPRPKNAVIVDLERLYALGIDAFRISQDLTTIGAHSGYALDGVTGQISLSSDHQFVRELTPAIFYRGQAVVLYEPKR